MERQGPVIVIEDDEDDQYLFEQAYRRLNLSNELIFFSNCQEALEYLRSTSEIPFLIMSDVNMSDMSGFDLRAHIHIDAAIHDKCIPYLFFSTAASQRMVIDAYGMSVQGFFVKPVSMDALERTIRTIVDYWQLCAAPNNYPA